ncbi:MAG: hypothetical protein ACKVQS_01175 [Fimbriimonadaceae bacterium]
MKFWKKGAIVGVVALVGFIVLCGLGGYSILRSFQDSAKRLEPEFDRAEKNGIPLVLESLEPERTLQPELNAALEYKKAFDIWANVRPEIEDSKWDSYVLATTANDDTRQMSQLFASVVDPIERASRLAEAQWRIDYSDRAFGTYPVFAGVVDGVTVWLKTQVLKDDGPQFISVKGVETGFQVSDHVLASRDPGSLRAASSIRMQVLRLLALELEEIRPELGGVMAQDQYKVYANVVNGLKPIDSLPVWRRTAFLQLDTWIHYDDLKPAQQAIFGGARRDDGVMIDAASTEILKFWNGAIESAEGKPELEQYLLLGDAVLKMRDRVDLVGVPLKQLWTLDSATKGVGSLDWILADEQLMMVKQALDVLVSSESGLPQSFECKRVSVVGMKPYTYERTETGFKISAKPSERLAPDSALAKQSLVYEFKSRR